MQYAVFALSFFQCNLSHNTIKKKNKKKLKMKEKAHTTSKLFWILFKHESHAFLKFYFLSSSIFTSDVLPVSFACT